MTAKMTQNETVNRIPTYTLMCYFDLRKFMHFH